MEQSIPMKNKTHTPIPEEAWHKKGVTRNDRINGVGKKILSVTLDEAVNPQPMEFYDYARVENFLSLNDETVLVNAYCSFLQKKASLKLTAHLKNKITGEYLGAVPMAEAKNVEKHCAQAEICIGSHIPSELAVVVEAEIGNDESTEILFLSNDSCLVSAPTLNPRYEHIYPKKEPVTVIFGNNPQGVLPVEFHSDPAHIVISLFRAPQQSGDSDYVCNYGHGSHGRAILAIPAKGVIDFGRSVIVTPKLEDAFAIIERKDKGGISYVVRENHFRLPIVKDGKIQYEVKTNWECELDQDGNLDPYYYDYTLSFTVNYQLKASQVVRKMKFTASNKVFAQSFNGAELVYPLLPLKIMWGCLAEDTIVQTVDGVKMIQEIRIGDSVVCPESGTAVRVDNVWTGTEQTLIQLTYDNEALRLTPSHPVAISENGACKFKRAAHVKKGDLLLGNDKRTMTIQQVEIVAYGKRVYNLTLDSDKHCFYAANVVVGDTVKENEDLS